MFAHQKNHVSITSVFNEFRVFWNATHAAIIFALLFFTSIAQAGQVSLAWNPNTQSTLGGYKLSYGTASGNYSSSVDVGKQATYTVVNLRDGAKYYFAVKAYDTTRTVESSFSNEVSTTIGVTSTPIAAPTASFSASPTSGTAPLMVTLVDTSTGSISSRAWTFSDGTTDTAKTVIKTFNTPGSYTATLKVTGSGGSDTTTRSISVTTSPLPVANFNASPTSGTAPLTVKFTDTSTGTVTAWSWDFGDGTPPSTQRNPSHSYATTGTYTVKLTTTNSAGSNAKTQKDYIKVSSNTGTGSSAGKFQQGIVAPNLVVMEAEHFTSNTAQSGYAWQATTSYGNYSGASALRALPEDNTRIDTNYAATSPRLDYQVNFVKTGTHYVWIRALGPSWSSDSLHVGLDGQEVASAARLSQLNPQGSWAWSKTTQGGTIATLNVTNPGIHIINVWMRESGTLLDKLVLTPNANYTPSDLGPDETVSTTIGTATLPSPWIDMDIGKVGQVGSASYASGAFTVKGSGDDIWDNADAFHFVFQSMTGDGSIVARVASIDYTNPWAKAGVMIRESLDADARHAMAVVTVGNGVGFQRRITPGGTSYYTAGAAVDAPYWVKLTRSGSTFTAYRSADGSTWAPVGSATISMATSVYVGLALTSHNNSTLNASVLDNVSKRTN